MRSVPFAHPCAAGWGEGARLGALLLCVFIAACQSAPPAENSLPRDTAQARASTAPHACRALRRAVRARAARARVSGQQDLRRCAARAAPPEQICASIASARQRADFDLRQFVAASFTPPPQATPPTYRRPCRARTCASTSIAVEGARAQAGRSAAVLIATAAAQRYIVPGGRFNEIYYWDSYFTMLGLEESGRHDLTISMLDNFALAHRRVRPHPERQSHLLPQPLAAAVLRGDGRARRARDGDATYREISAAAAARVRVLDGRRGLARARRARIVASCGCADGTLLNRYWDDRDTPREEVVSRGRCDRARVAARRPPRSIAICAPRPRAAGTSARAGSRTARRSRRFTRPI